MAKKKIIISPAQALLILIERYNNNTSMTSELKQLYLCGADSPLAEKTIKNYLSDEVLNKYQISFDKDVINNDPTRRYFETHLAYETIISQIQNHSDELFPILNKINEQLFIKLPDHISYDVSSVLKNGASSLSEEDLVLTNMLPDDYSFVLRDIASSTLFPNFNENERNTAICIVQNIYLAVLNARYDPDLPLDIYDKGIYSEKNRGKMIIPIEDTTRNQHLGLLKNYMPLARDDIARSDRIIPYLKPSDQARYIENAQWVEQNFNKLVHPFSNGISGTILCQLRCLNNLLNHSASNTLKLSASELQEYLKAIISIRLFSGGGHSLNEYLSPLELPEIREAFHFIEDFDQINLQSMFLKDNQSAFEAGLTKAIKFNCKILERALMHEEFKEATSEVRDRLSKTENVQKSIR